MEDVQSTAIGFASKRKSGNMMRFVKNMFSSDTELVLRTRIIQIIQYSLQALSMAYINHTC